MRSGALARISAAWGVLRGRPQRRSAFKAADVNRTVLDWVTGDSAIDDDLRFNLARLRSRARDLERNSPVARHFLRMVAVNVVGPNGVRCRPQIRQADDTLDREANRFVLDAWTDWSRAATIGGRVTFNSFSRQVIRGVARDGEAFVRLWRGFDNRFGFALEYIDPMLVDESYNKPPDQSGNEVRLGIEVDEFGRPLAYHVWDSPQRLIGSSSRNRLRIPADQMLHIYDPEQANQSRGVSWMVAVMQPMKMLDGYREAEVVAARLGAAKMGFFQRKEGLDTSTLSPDERGNLEMEANPGTFLVLPDGYEVSAWTPDHPSSAYASFVKDKMREIATGLGVSYNSLASDLEGVNYSSMRSGLLIERDLWRTYQNWWIDSVLTPVYREWIAATSLRSITSGGAEGVAVGGVDIYAPPRWSPRGWPWVDPLKDVQATKEAIEAGLGSRHQALAEQGLDYEETLEELAVEDELAAEYGVDVEVNTGPVSTVTDGGSASADDEGSPAPNGNVKKSINNANHRRRF